MGKLDFTRTPNGTLALSVGIDETDDLLDSGPMTTSYNAIAGQNVERLAALSDGIFAVAMTLLVLDLRVPATEAVRSEHDLWHALAALSPQIIMYMMSFITLGIFWVGQQTQLNYLARSNRSLAWIHIAVRLQRAHRKFGVSSDLENAV